MVLISRIEEVFNMQLTGDEIADLSSVGDARAALRSRNLIS
jgi:acyl carrier protein